jgi:hypothetical protein
MSSDRLRRTGVGRGAAVPALVGLLALILLGGCALWQPDARPGRTTFASPLAVVPAVTLANTLVVELSWDRHGPWRFLIDTGSSVTLVSSDFAARYADRRPGAPAPPVRVRSASGGSALLDAVTVRRLPLGDVRFDHVPALVYDFSELSDHFGERIDGVLGFPLFRNAVLTLDYPRSRILLMPLGGASELNPGARVAFDTTAKIPLIQIELDGRSLLALIDSGSDGGVQLNPVGLNPRFRFGPTPAGTAATLAGDRPRELGRLDGEVRVGAYRLRDPVVDLTGELSAIGGGVLRHFSVTFNQRRGDVTFFRDSTAPLISAGVRSSGLSFRRTPAYWQVVAVVPGSPADGLGIQNGDLVTRIDGEPVSAWPLRRFEPQVAEAESLTLTFLHGREERSVQVPIFDLIPP